MKKRRWTDEQMMEAIKNNKTIAGVVRSVGLRITGENYNTVKKFAHINSIDTSHWLGQGYLKGGHCTWATKRTYDEILVENSDYTSTHHLKRRLIKDGILINVCSICGQEPMWNGKELVLILDHINGERSDNRRENLRLLCPHCNSQQATFCGRNIKIIPICSNRVCSICGKKITSQSKSGKCIKCVKVGRVYKTMIREERVDKRKCVRPSFDVLKKEVEELGFCAVGRKYGVSDNAIRKWLK